MGEREYGIDPETVDVARRRDRRRPVGRARGRDRRRRRQHLPRHGRRRRGHGPRDRRLPGMLATVLNALAVQDALERRGADTRVLSALERRGGRRAVHPPPRDPPPREGPDRDLRRRHRQPVLHDRHRRRAARARDRRRGDPDGEERRRGRLRRRPAHGPEREVPARSSRTSRRSSAASGDGHDRALALHGQQAADPRLRARRRATSGASSPASGSARSSRRHTTATRSS